LFRHFPLERVGGSAWRIVWEYAPQRVLLRMTAQDAIGGQDRDVFEMRFVSVNVLRMSDACETGSSEVCLVCSCLGRIETIGRGQIANEMYRVLKMLRIR
jgi:hypothetical protein